MMDSAADDGTVTLPLDEDADAWSFRSCYPIMSGCGWRQIHIAGIVLRAPSGLCEVSYNDCGHVRNFYAALRWFATRRSPSDRWI